MDVSARGGAEHEGRGGQPLIGCQWIIDAHKSSNLSITPHSIPRKQGGSPLERPLVYQPARPIIAAYLLCFRASSGRREKKRFS